MPGEIVQPTVRETVAPAPSQRALLLRESPLEMLERHAAALAFLLKPRELRELPAFVGAALADRLRGGTRVPDLSRVRNRPDGFAGVATDLSAEALLEGHRRGFFPHGHIGRPSWWMPARRGVLHLAETHMPRRLRGLLRNGGFTATLDRAFDEVLAACAARRPGRPYLTWLTPGMRHAYAGLYDLGQAHSLEVWDTAGALAGGLFGVATGRIFAVQSMFHRADHASKVGLMCLHHALNERGFEAVDFQYITPLTRQMGYRELPRDEVVELFTRHSRDDPDVAWRDTIDTGAVAEWRR